MKYFYKSYIKYDMFILFMVRGKKDFIIIACLYIPKSAIFKRMSNLEIYDVKTFWRKCMYPNFTCIIEGWFRCHYTVCCSNTKCLHNLGRQKGRLPNKRAILTAFKRAPKENKLTCLKRTGGNIFQCYSIIFRKST